MPTIMEPETKWSNDETFSGGRITKASVQSLFDWTFKETKFVGEFETKTRASYQQMIDHWDEFTPESQQDLYKTLESVRGKVPVNKDPIKTDKVTLIFTGLVLAFIIWSMFFMGQSKNSDDGWRPVTNTVRTTQTDSFGNVNTSEVEVNGMISNDGFFVADPRSN